MSFLSRFRRNVLAFPLAALAALAMLAISEASYQDATSSLDRLGERGTARSKLNDLVKSLLDAETGQRGYLLTERREYLRPYEQAQKETRELLAWLGDYYAKDPKTGPTMAEVAKATEAKLSELATTIELHDHGVENGWRELMLSDIGREKMEHVRTLGEKLIEHETAQVAIGRRSVYETLWLNRIGVSAMAAVSLLALFMYLRQTATLDRALADEADRMSGERDRLELEVTARTTQLRELAQHLQTIREDERSRLARELHDELGALLTAAKLDVARLKSRLGASASADATERLAHLNESLNGGIALKRRIIEDLRPSSLSNLGLVAALEILLREFAGRSEIKVIDRLEPSSSTPGGAAHHLSSGPGGAHQRRQVRQGDRGRRQPAGAERRRRACLGARQRHRLRHRAAAPAEPWPARHALSRRGRRRFDAAVIQARRGDADRSDAAAAARRQRRPGRSRRSRRPAAGGGRMNVRRAAVGRVLPGRGVSPDSGARAAPIARIRRRLHTDAVVSSGLRAREAESATHQQRNIDGHDRHHQQAHGPAKPGHGR